MLSAGGPYADVYKLLDDIRSNLTTEQATQLQIYNDQIDDCTDEVNIREHEMAEADSANKAASTKHLACTGAE